MDDLSDIREMYNSAWDAESTRLQRHQLEADITWRYLDRYLSPEGHLLDIGCGTGAYAFPLAERGYRITAVDLAEELIRFRTLQIAAVEPAISADDESYNALDGRQRELWLNLLFEMSAEPSMLASSRHLLYVGRRAR